jgi:hypothetical protein
MTDEQTPQAPIEAPITAQEPAAPETPKLSNREALQQAISEVREAPEAPRREAPASEPTTKAEVKDAMEERVEPPAEFSAAAKKAWHDGDVKTVQKEFRRIQDERTKEVTRAQRAEREAYEKAKPMRDLAEKVRSYFAARGDDVPDDVKIIQAVNLVNQMRGTDKSKLKAELKAAGIDIDAAPNAQAPDPSVLLENPEIKSLLTFKEELLKEREEQQFGQVRNLFQDSFEKLSALKNRTGEPVFPDLFNTSDDGKRFAQEIGSLTADPRFREGVVRRFPDADHTVLVREAYKYLGGKVSGDPVTVSPEKQQKHVEKSRRAAASTPGRVVVRNESSNLVGKLSNRAALARALEESREH